jgi:hypothetical protein
MRIRIRIKKKGRIRISSKVKLYAGQDTHHSDRIRNTGSCTCSGSRLFNKSGSRPTQFLEQKREKLVQHIFGYKTSIISSLTS